LKREGSKLVLLCVSLVCLSLLLASESSGQLDTTDLLAVWLMDKGSGEKVLDSSENNFNGFFQGGKPKWVDGVFGKALQFEGGPGFVQIEKPIIVDSVDVSIGAWIKPAKTQKTWTNILASHQEINGAKRGISFEQWGDNHNSWTAPLGTGADWNVDMAGGKKIFTEVEAEVWQHLAYVRKGTKATMYLDGKVSFADGKVSKEPVADALGFRIGESQCCPGRNFDGLIDEGFIFKRALSHDEIKSITKGWEAALSLQPQAKVPIAWGSIKTQYQ
jgi:hypothetical protein